MEMTEVTGRGGVQEREDGKKRRPDNGEQKQEGEKLAALPLKQHQNDKRPNLRAIHSTSKIPFTSLDFTNLYAELIQAHVPTTLQFQISQELKEIIIGLYLNHIFLLCCVLTAFIVVTAAQLSPAAFMHSCSCTRLIIFHSYWMYRANG